MRSLSRRGFVSLGLAASLGGPRSFPGWSFGPAAAAEPRRDNVHQQLLDLAARQQEQRRARFAAVKTRADLDELQKSLRVAFLRLLDGLPQSKGSPPAQVTGKIEAYDYLVEKLVFESFPGYFVSALLYKPKKTTVPCPGVISPCGHSAVGKAAAAYQILHINLVKRGHVVLTYDPVGQGERSQFWDADKGRSRFNLSCGEHAVLGNPLYLLGSSLARYRIWDGIRALDYLVSLPEVDPKRLGCVGNSGGGTLTAYIAALDPRVTAAAICCYITTLPRRMGNRIQADPDADPEQDIFGFVSEGIDHAGLVALRAPRPTLLGTARFDFFPIEGARESFEEAKKLFEAAGAGDRIERVEAAEKHGLTLPLRQGVYAWFDRWLLGRKVEGAVEEVKVEPRPAGQLLVCAEGQVNVAFKSRPLLPLALEELGKNPKPARSSLRELLRLDPEQADFQTIEVAAGGKDNRALVVCVNGNEAAGWQNEKAFLEALQKQGCAVVVVNPRGVGPLRPDLAIKGHDYTDPLVGVEENLAYNAFLVGKSLLGMRVADVLEPVGKLTARMKGRRVVLCGRRDSALVACLAATVEPKVKQLAVEEMLLSYRLLFEAAGRPINAASILPDLLRRFGDVTDVLAETGPRKVLVAAGVVALSRRLPWVEIKGKCFSSEPGGVLDWIGE